MSVFYIKKGKDIKLKGAADKRIVDTELPAHAAIQPPDFKGLKPRVLVKEEEYVSVGTPLLEHKDNTDIKIVSPASGKVIAVNRGAKRALLEIVIETDGKQDAVQLRKFDREELKKCSRADIVDHLLQGGVWPVIRQRPFSKIANTQDKPKSIFIHAMNTDPLALDIDVILNGREKEFQLGIDILSGLTDGKVYLCHGTHEQSSAITQAQKVDIHQFSGPHPAGNVGTHIHYIDPIQKGEIVWYVRAEDVLRIAHLFHQGSFSPERFVAVTGEGAKERVYKRTIIGAPLEFLSKAETPFGFRFITGSALSGRNVGPKGYLGFYDSQITVLPEGGQRELLGWLAPGLDKYTFSKTFLSAFAPQKEMSLNADENGGHRAIVLNHLYDDLNTLDIMTFFLLKAVIAGDIDEAEKLGILECAEEDFALCTFACPSKTDVGAIIQEGLNTIEKEG